jgi:glycerophosphoryl diester phosphodiesterase
MPEEAMPEASRRDRLARRGALHIVRAVRRFAPAARFDVDGPLILGHRGAMARAPENTLGAFRAAIDDGGDGWELDTQLADDGVPIVLHDDVLDRTTTGKGTPLGYASSALRALDAGTWFGPAWSSERVPTLDEALACAPDGKVVNVEIKGPTPRGRPLERAVVDVVRRHVPRIRVIVSSFHPPQLFFVRRVDPTIPLGLLIDPDAPWPVRTLWPAAVVLPEALHPPSSLVDAAFVRAAHKAGLRVHVWAVKSDDDARRLLALGVDGLIVDDVAAGVRVRSARR